jgi:hypothetical protein
MALNRFEIGVSTEVLEAAAGQVETDVRRLDTVFDEVLQLVRCTAEYWIGNAGDSCRESILRSQEHISTVRSRLYEYPADLLAMAGIYHNAENENAETPAALADDIIY